jgi:SAM-dependent methyltransferase
MKIFEYSSCRCCNDNELVEWLRLPDSPIANALCKVQYSEKYPLSLKTCLNCGHLQLAAVPDSAPVFVDYRYKSGISNSFQEHFKTYANDIVQTYGVGKVLEVGSNDGFLLQQFAKLGCDVVGVEPSVHLRQDHEARSVKVVTDFFSPDLIENHSWSDRFDIVCANNVLAHLTDSYSVMKSISTALKPGGVLIAECGDQAGIFSGEYLDNVYHEHIDYYSPYSFSVLAARVGLLVEKVTLVNTHGVSFRVIARKVTGKSKIHRNIVDLNQTRKQVLQGIEARRNRVLSELSGREFIAYGAAAKAVTSLFTLDLVGSGLIGVVDDNELKQGLYFPGTNLLIGDPKTIDKDAIILVAAWNVFADIKANLLSRGHKGEILCL